MSYDFLPDKQQQQTQKPNAEAKPMPKTGGKKGGKSSGLEVGKNLFFDTYKNHFDAQNIFRVPAVKEDFILPHNYEVANRVFDKSEIDRYIRKNFYGVGTEADKLLNGYTNFSNRELLDKTLKISAEKIPDQLFSDIEKPTMNINDRFGMFSFDLAAMSMYYVYDYFTKAGVKVDANQVVKIKNKFYDQTTNTEVIQKIKRRKNGTPFVVSTNRKCFIDFENQKSKQKSVEIIVLNSFAFSEKVDNLIYNSIAAISVAKQLLLKGFKVKLTSLLVVKDKGINYFHLVPVKNYNETLDPNAAAYVCGDPRFFRFQGFKLIIKGYDSVKNKSPYALGSITSNLKEVSKIIEQDYVPNSFYEQADSRLYFGGSRNIKSVQNEVEQALVILKKNYGNKN